MQLFAVVAGKAYLCAMTDNRRTFTSWLNALLLAFFMAMAPTATTAAQGVDAARQQERGTVLASLPDKAQAVLADASQLVQLCGQRPERLSSASQYGGPSGQTLPRIHHLFHLQHISFCHYRGGGALLSSPIMALPACRYYVYTLGHLLC